MRAAADDFALALARSRIQAALSAAAMRLVMTIVSRQSTIANFAMRRSPLARLSLDAHRDDF